MNDAPLRDKVHTSSFNLQISEIPWHKVHISLSFILFLSQKLLTLVKENESKYQE